MEAVRPETLAFLAPGLLHQFGNVLFTIQGNAQSVGLGADNARERTAILGATERGGNALRVLRCLLGDGSQSPAPAGLLLGQLVELLRVPVREAQFTLEMRHSARQTPVLVDPLDFAKILVEAVRCLVGVLPTGLRGTVVLDLCDLAERHATVRVMFQPQAGGLPFPLPSAELQGRLDLAGLHLRSRPQLSTHGAGFEIVFAGRGVSQPAEA